MIGYGELSGQTGDGFDEAMKHAESK